MNLIFKLKRAFRKTYLSDSELKILIACEDKWGYVFWNLNWLKMALTHKSYANEKKLDLYAHNERLEFLGDAVLELCVSDLLYLRFPEAKEGDLSKMRASLVNETTLAELAKSLNLGAYLFLGKGEDLGLGREKNSLIADAFEAWLGAVYLDAGFKSAYHLVVRLFTPLLDKATTQDINRDYKTKLQEELQTRYKLAPEYRLLSQEGPDHDKVFQIEVRLKGEPLSMGTGKSKKQAEQNAAKNALDNLTPKE